MRSKLRETRTSKKKETTRVGRARPGTMDDDDASHDDEDDDGRIATANRDGDRSIDSRDDSNSNSNSDSNRVGIHSFV